jgi:hypothetical protein
MWRWRWVAGVVCCVCVGGGTDLFGGMGGSVCGGGGGGEGVWRVHQGGSYELPGGWLAAGGGWRRVRGCIVGLRVHAGAPRG